MTRKRKILLSLLLIAVLASGSWAGITFYKAKAAGGAGLDDLRTALEVAALIRTQYVQPVDFKTLVLGYVKEGTINGMIKRASLDPYTRYMDPAAFKQMQIDTISGVFGGIGIYVGLQDERITIIAPIEGTPGFRAGLRSGDRIVAIDGREIQDMSLDEAVALMRGGEGTRVKLRIERGEKEKEQLDVAIVRAVIQAPAVSKTQMLDDQVGYIKLLQFSEPTSREMRTALQKLDGRGMKALILDFRYNPGGLLNAAIDVANLFIEWGPIVHIVGRDQQKESIEAFPRGTHPRIPMIVLVNKYSASASEIVAGALQDSDVATLVGTKTFGKGLVQTVIPLRDGSGLSLTTQKYLTAGGRDIHQQGIVPDVVVELPEDYKADLQGVNQTDVDLKDVQLRKAMEILQQKLRTNSARKAG